MNGLKKVQSFSLEEKKGVIEVENQLIPIYRQCELAGLNRSTFYYTPVPASPYILLLMRLIDEQYTKTPFYGVPRMTIWLNNQSHNVNHKRVERLMGIQAVYPKRNLSIPDKGHMIYSYLLKGLNISHPDHVWASDITFIRMRKGFIYLTAIMDWFSRYILSWKISITIDAKFCIEALSSALTMGTPDIFNSDQGPQFTSSEFTSCLLDKKIRISMDGRGRVFDNIFIERLWREVYLKDYADVWEAEDNLNAYFHFYNTERPHSALGYMTPYEVYYGKRKTLSHIMAMR